MDEHERDEPDEQQDLVRSLLQDAGREPTPLPGHVRDRLDDVLAGLVAERGATPGSPAVVPLDRARSRRRRRVQVLVAAAAVVVGGYAAGASGVLQGVSSGEADSATAGDAGGAGAPEEAPVAGAPVPGSFPLSSGSLRGDARRLVAADPAAYVARQRAPLASAPERATGDSVTGGPGPGPQTSAGADAGEDPELAEGGSGGRTGLTSGCVDPLAPPRLTRLVVTYDGSAATAVVQPLRAAADGTGRVRVEVWDCRAPVRLAAVVVRR